MNDINPKQQEVLLNLLDYKTGKKFPWYQALCYKLFFHILWRWNTSSAFKDTENFAKTIKQFGGELIDNEDKFKE